MRGCSRVQSSSANPTSGHVGASTDSTMVRLTTNTSTPATAESPASSAIEPRICELSLTPVRRTATTRAAAVQTPPGMYFASIETISACSATGYESRMSSERRIQIHPTTKAR